MSNVCSKCQTDNGPGARYCGGCGAMLGTTALNGNTVLAEEPARAATPQPVTSAVPAMPQAVIPAGMQTSALPQSQNQRELTVFVLDISGSMAGEYDVRYSKLEAAVRAATSLIAQKARVDPNDEIALVTFNHQAATLCSLTPLSTGRKNLFSQLKNLSPEGGTDINKGIKEADRLLDWNRPNVVRRIVLLTDGQGGHPLRTARKLKDQGVIIDTIGVGDDPSNVDEKLLRTMASVIQKENRYRFIKDQQTLVLYTTQLGNKTQLS